MGQRSMSLGVGPLRGRPDVLRGCLCPVYPRVGGWVKKRAMGTRSVLNSHFAASGSQHARWRRTGPGLSWGKCTCPSNGAPPQNFLSSCPSLSLSQLRISGPIAGTPTRSCYCESHVGVPAVSSYEGGFWAAWRPHWSGPAAMNPNGRLVGKAHWRPSSNGGGPSSSCTAF